MPLDTRPPGGLIGPPGWRSGWWYPLHSGHSTATAGTQNGAFRCTPVVIPYPLTISALAAEVTVAGEAGCVLRLGVYADDGQGAPGALILDAGTVPGDVVAVASVAVSATLPAGMLWVGTVTQGAPTTVPTVRTNGSGTPLPSLIPVASGALPGTGTWQGSAFTVSSTLGAGLPATAGTLSPTGSWVARVFARVA